MKYRAPLTLCYLMGRTTEEAAQELGCSGDAVRGRLAMAKDLLRSRLAKKGVVVSSTLLGTALAENAASASVPVACASATLQAALSVLGHGSTMSASVAALVQQGVHQMFMARVKMVAAVLIAVLFLGAGAGLVLIAGKGQNTADAADKKGKEPAKKDASKEKAKTTDPLNVPLELKLVAKKGSYTLDLGGKTEQEYRKLLTTTTPPPAPAVDLELVFRNSGEKEVKFLVGGDNPDMPLLLKLDGAGAVNIDLKAVENRARSESPTTITLAPGKTHALPLQSLQTKNLNRPGSASFWTQPGEYTLTATYHTSISPAPKGAPKAANPLPGWSKAPDGFGRVVLTSSPVTLKVVAPEKEKVDGKKDDALKAAIEKADLVIVGKVSKTGLSTASSFDVGEIEVVKVLLGDEKVKSTQFKFQSTGGGLVAPYGKVGVEGVWILGGKVGTTQTVLSFQPLTEEDAVKAIITQGKKQKDGK